MIRIHLILFIRMSETFCDIIVQKKYWLFLLDKKTKLTIDL